jgi:hypothetical protein
MIDNLPDPVKDVIYIVNKDVACACPNRKDVFFLGSELGIPLANMKSVFAETMLIHA